MKHLLHSILFFITLLLLNSCNDKKIHPTENIKILGKGGMGTFDLYPMNSYESLLAALARNPDGLEIDVHLSKDNVLVAYHSNTLEDETNLKGIIREKNWEEIRQGNFTTSPYVQHTIVSIDTLLSQNPELRDLIISLDCKLSHPKIEKRTNYFQDFAHAILHLQEKYPTMKTNFIVESTEFDFLNIVKEKTQNTNCFYNHSNFNAAVNTALLWHFDGIVMKDKDINKEQVQAAKAENLKVQIWESTWRGHKKNLEKQPDYLQTISLKKVLGK